MDQVHSRYSVGLRNVGSYQVAGHPYLTGSATLAAGAEEQIKFPTVAKSVVVINHAAHIIRVHFNSSVANGSVLDNRHYVELDSDEDSFTFNVKCKEIWISAPAANGGEAQYQIYAELTGIPTSSMYPMTGAGLTD